MIDWIEFEGGLPKGKGWLLVFTDDNRVYRVTWLDVENAWVTDQLKDLFNELKGDTITYYAICNYPEEKEEIKPIETLKVDKENWLEGVKRDIISGGSAMNTRRAVVIHFTAGSSAKSSIDHMRNTGLSCHLVIDRDGTIYQCQPFDKTCGHAGESRWVDPNTGKKYTGLNSCTIGIELANAGDNPTLAKKWSKLPLVKAKHKNGGSEKEWEQYPQAQLDACFAATKALVERYNLDDVTGHDCIAPERKNDPGPAFPMGELRAFCGFKGLPKVHWK